MKKDTMKKTKKENEFLYFWEKPEKMFSIAEVKPININETEKEIIVKSYIPGFKRSEIVLNLTDTSVEILAQKKEEKVEQTEKFFKQERSSGSVRKAFMLPKKINPEGSKAHLDDGVLTIIMPKAGQEKKKKKNIEIN